MVGRWSEAIITPIGWFRTSGRTPQDLRTSSLPPIEPGGWHLSYFGDKEFISNKIQHFGHQEYNRNEYTDPDAIEKRMLSQQDIFGRGGVGVKKIPVSENPYLPPRHADLLSRFVLY
jgi:hypothetical protein